MGLRLPQSLPENGWLYPSDQAEEIATETIRQVNLIISYYKNIGDIMRAHQALVFLYTQILNAIYIAKLVDILL